MSTSFRRASSRRTRIKAALCGPSKSGKTFSSIYLGDLFLKRLSAAGFPAGNGRIAVIDSENGRSEYYGVPEGGQPGPGQFDFDIYDLYQVKPESYADAFKEAAGVGYGLIIVDSITHEWAGKGGLLDAKAQLVATGGKNSFTAFDTITPRHNDFIEAIVRYPGHLIATIRAKTDYAMESNGGKTTVQKVGLGPVQRDGIEYEFDIFGMVSPDHSIVFECRGQLAARMNGRRFAPEEVPDVAAMMADFIIGSSVMPASIITGDEIVALKELGSEIGMGEANWATVLKGQKAKAFTDLSREQFDKVRTTIIATKAKKEGAAANI